MTCVVAVAQGVVSGWSRPSWSCASADTAWSGGVADLARAVWRGGRCQPAWFPGSVRGLTLPGSVGWLTLFACGGWQVTIPLSMDIIDPSSAVRRVFCQALPFTLSDKVLADPLRATKEFQAKERDLFANMVQLTEVAPLAVECRVPKALFTVEREGREAGSRVSYAGDALIVYPHPALGRIALRALQRGAKLHTLPGFGKVSLALASSGASQLAGAHFSSPDLVRFGLAAMRQLEGQVARVFPRLGTACSPALDGEDSHALAAEDQSLLQQQVLRKACVAGFSMTDATRAKFVTFLTEMSRPSPPCSYMAACATRAHLDAPSLQLASCSVAASRTCCLVARTCLQTQQPRGEVRHAADAE